MSNTLLVELNICWDFQIKEEAFLEDINNLLNSGEVPNMFPNDEKAEICEKMRGIDRQKDRSLQTDGSPLALFNLFVERVKQQLHIVLGMSPIGDNFRCGITLPLDERPNSLKPVNFSCYRNRLRMFPSLVNCCTINWFEVS